MAFAEFAKQSKSKNDLNKESRIGTSKWTDIVQVNKENQKDFKCYYNDNIMAGKENQMDFKCREYYEDFEDPAKWQDTMIRSNNGTNNIRTNKENHKDFKGLKGSIMPVFNINCYNGDISPDKDCNCDSTI